MTQGDLLMAQTAFVRARIDEDLKDEAAAVLGEMGLTVSDLVRITLTRVAKDRALPFEIKVPNAETIAAMKEARRTMKAGRLPFATAEELFRDLDSQAGRK
jgi:DNA-damage-inducible protein J